MRLINAFSIPYFSQMISYVWHLAWFFATTSSNIDQFTPHWKLSRLNRAHSWELKEFLITFNMSFQWKFGRFFDGFPSKKGNRLFRIFDLRTVFGVFLLQNKQKRIKTTQFRSQHNKKIKWLAKAIDLNIKHGDFLCEWSRLEFEYAIKLIVIDRKKHNEQRRMMLWAVNFNSYV